MARRVITAALALTALAAGGQARAVTVDPDAFAHGTVIRNAFPNVTLTAQGCNLPNDNVLAWTDPLASTGINSFAHGITHYLQEELEWGNGYNHWMRADFANGAIRVSIDFIADDDTDDDALLRAFNAGGTELDSDASVGVYSTGEVVTLTVEAPDIAYVLIEPDVGAGSAWHLDHLVYDETTVIPEPVSAFGVMMGLCLIAHRLRRRR